MAIFAGSSFALLFLSIILSLEIVFRTTRYMYERARTHNTTLVNLVTDMKGVMSDLEDMRKLATIESSVEIDTAFNDHYKRMQKFMAWRESINEHMFRGQDMKKGDIKKRLAADRQRAADSTRLRMLSRAISRWRGSSKATNEGVRERSEFTGHVDDGTSSDDTSSGVVSTDLGFQSFSVFWDTHCHFVSSAAHFCFYGGTTLLLLDITIFVYAKFKFTYANGMAGWITAGCVFGALFMGLIVLCYFRLGNVVIFRNMKNWKKDDGTTKNVSTGSRDSADDDIDVEEGIAMDDRPSATTNARRRHGPARGAAVAETEEERHGSGRIDPTRYSSFRSPTDMG